MCAHVCPWLNCFKCFSGVKLDNTDIEKGCSHHTQILFKPLFVPLVFKSLVFNCHSALGCRLYRNQRNGISGLRLLLQMASRTICVTELSLPIQMISEANAKIKVWQGGMACLVS